MDALLKDAGTDATRVRKTLALTAPGDGLPRTPGDTPPPLLAFVASLQDVSPILLCFNHAVRLHANLHGRPLRVRSACSAKPCAPRLPRASTRLNICQDSPQACVTTGRGPKTACTVSERNMYSWSGSATASADSSCPAPASVCARGVTMTMLHTCMKLDGMEKAPCQEPLEATDVPAAMLPCVKQDPMRPFGYPDRSVDSERARTSS